MNSCGNGSTKLSPDYACGDRRQPKHNLKGLFSNDNTSNKRSFINNIMDRSKTFDLSAASEACQGCRRFTIDLTNASDSLNATDAELKASRQVISLLQRQLELSRLEKDGLEKLIVARSKLNINPTDEHIQNNNTETVRNEDSSDPRQEPLLKLIRTQLYAKDEEIMKLKTSLKDVMNEKEQMSLQVHMLEEDISKLRSENSLLQENLALRDQTIVSLSNEVFESSDPNQFNHANRRRQSSVEVSSNQYTSSFKAQRQMVKLMDNLEAYKKTNAMLSNNIIKLTDKCAQAERKELETRSQCQELEAKCCQIQSKLLSLLKEIEQSAKQTSVTEAENTDSDVVCSESVRLLIKRLLEDKSLDIPLSWKEGNRPRRKSITESDLSKYECDELGFYVIPDSEEIGNSCNSAAQPNTRLSKRTGSPIFPKQLPTIEELIDKKEQSNNSDKSGARLSVDATKIDEEDWRIRWDEFIKDFDKKDLNKCREFKDLLRSGIPQEYRCKVWKFLVDLRVGKTRQRFNPDYYQSLLGTDYPLNKKGLNPSSKQIELDLLRTLPNNKYFETLDSPGTTRLRRVLSAYSRHNTKVGYCQGMNRLAAVALLILPEEEAFWCLAAIVDNIMPSGYYNDLWLAQVDSNVVMDLAALKMPNLSNHFKNNSIELSLFAWFLTIFVDGAQPALFLRLWDCFLYEGDKIMFRISLSLLKMHESHLLELNNSVAVNNFLRSAVSSLIDIDGLFSLAFKWTNPLPGRLLKIKRQHHFQIVRTGIGSETGNKSIGDSADGKKFIDNNKDDEDSLNGDSSIMSI